MRKGIKYTISNQSAFSRGTSSQTGLVRTEDLLLREIFNCTLRTCESSLGMTSTMTAKGHRFLGASMSLRRTTSPCFRSGCTACHLRRSWSVCMRVLLLPSCPEPICQDLDSFPLRTNHVFRGEVLKVW